MVLIRGGRVKKTFLVCANHIPARRSGYPGASRTAVSAVRKYGAKRPK